MVIQQSIARLIERWNARSEGPGGNHARDSNLIRDRCDPGNV